MPAKVAFIGAGSTVFAKNLMGDILSYPELQDTTLSLHDINEERLNTSAIVANQINKTLNANATIETTTDRRKAVDGADYVITMFQIGGYKPSTVIDFEIPKKYGLRQTIADTLGIGGIMRGLRTIPVLLDLCHDMEELCPDATLLQYVNPMVANCWAINRATKIKTVGLCHSVQGTASQLARDIDVPIDEINYVCAGINHMAFYLRFERKNGNGTEDLYPKIRQVLEAGNAPDWNLVRYEMFKRLGYFVTESSEHFSEYVPWFIKRDRPDLLEEFNIPLDEYIRRCEVQITGWEFMKQKLENPDADLSEAYAAAMKKAGVPEESLPRVVERFENMQEVKRSHEYGSGIIHSMETGDPRVIYGNVANDGLIDNLPAGCTVEVPCLVDKNGVQPVAIGELPPHLAALMQTNLNVHNLTTEAALTG
ncbi:MAG: alpha-glucosidase/alpha-galactosidase, partial [Caldilineaceae bacterium]|nr:alpha-glucosidase/alpha-galactosidase [Caldilineaceae bacterium]